MLEILSDYLENKSQVVSVGKRNSTQMNVPQGSILGQLLFCMFIIDLPEATELSHFLFFGDDLKILAVNKTHHEIQTKLTALDRWATEKKIFIRYQQRCQTTFAR